MEILTRWMGRENPRDTDAYRHLTCDERLEQIRSSIRAGETSGQVVEFYNSIAPEEREEYLDGRIQAVHYTPGFDNLIWPHFDHFIWPHPG